jgi:hypothetical protein
VLSDQVADAVVTAHKAALHLLSNSAPCCQSTQLLPPRAACVPACQQFMKDARDQLWFIGLHSITFDAQQSRGSAATFTERWGEFLAGAGPPPAPQLSQHTSYGRSAAAADSSGSSTTAPAAAAAEQQIDGAVSRSAAGCSSPLQQLNRQFFPLLAVDVSELPSCRPQSAGAAAHCQAGSPHRVSMQQRWRLVVRCVL